MNSSRNGASSAELPRPGDLVDGKYRVDAVIGTGGMGVVLGAEDTSLGRKVAIKFLAPQKADREGAVARFLREARAAASIQSEHVVRIHEVGAQPNGASYIVMEHLVGTDLAFTLQSRGPLPVEEAVEYVLQACEAIGEAHGRGIVHRDLKPQNLFLTRRPDGSPIVKVLDFGISKAIDAAAPNLTSTDTIMGTPLYMSPEQVRSLKSVDHRSDIWSLGAILFELITKSPIYEAATATALCAAIAVDPPIPLRARRRDASPELEAIILRCLHKDPAGRFQDVAAFAQALAPFASPRGRAHAANIVQIVRAGAQTGGFAHAAPAPGPPPGPAPYAPTAGLSQSGSQSSLGFDPTVGTGGIGSAFPPGAMAPMAPVAPMHGSMHPAMQPSSHPASHPSMQPSHPSHAPHFQPAGQAYAQMAGPTTGNWQQGALAGKPPQKSGNGLVIALVVGLVVVVLLGGLGGGGYFLLTRASRVAANEGSENASASETAGPTGPGVQPPSTAVTTTNGTPTAVATNAPAAPTTPAATAPGKKPATPATPDAGAPGKDTKDAGAAPKPDEDLEAQKRIAQGQCNLYQVQLRSNDPKNNEQAKRVKTMSCLRASSPQGVTCERTACRQACSMLQDQSCLFQLDNAERNFPPRF